MKAAPPIERTVRTSDPRPPAEPGNVRRPRRIHPNRTVGYSRTPMFQETRPEPDETFHETSPGAPTRPRAYLPAAEKGGASDGGGS